MGYELSIQREDESNKIKVDEWRSYIDSDDDFSHTSKFSADLGNGKILTIPTPNAGIWKTDKGAVPFTFYEEYGWVSVKNPDPWIIEKMIQIADNLNAIVKGEEDELYDADYLKNVTRQFNEIRSPEISKKKWWKIWK